MSKEKDTESLEKLSSEQLKELLITHDYKGKVIKAEALEILIDRERQSAIESYLNAAYSYGRLPLIFMNLVFHNYHYEIEKMNISLPQESFSPIFKRKEIVILPCGAKAKVHSTDEWGNISLFGFRKTYHQKNLKKA